MSWFWSIAGGLVAGWLIAMITMASIALIKIAAALESISRTTRIRWDD